jgi:hypothetical protein
MTTVWIITKEITVVVITEVVILVAETWAGEMDSKLR